MSDQESVLGPLANPVSDDPDVEDGLEDGTGLCLSGGGYRAMLFHLGLLWRLNDLGHLPRLDRISSVSGGSITSAVLALAWNDLQFDSAGVSARFHDLVADPIHRMAATTIDEGSIIGGALLPGSIGSRVQKGYRKYLYGDKTLQDFPDEPRFVLNATNVQSGALWRFSKPYMADYRVGYVERPKVSVALAVGASSAFPPFLSPVELDLEPGRVLPFDTSDLHREPFTTEVVLTDGGVYDNLGLETVWKRYRTVLVSDGGGQMSPKADPKRDWARHAYRVNGLVDNQVRALRKRQVVGSFIRGDRKGAFWRTRSHVADFPATTPLPCPPDRTMELAQTATRLKSMDPVRQKRLVNWGYAISDVALRSWVNPDWPEPDHFPYPAAGI